MSSLARRIAPAAALGGVAIALVAIIDPALAGTPQGVASDASASALGDSTGTGGSSTSSTTESCSQNAQEVTGQSAMTRWGAVQVAATVANGQLCEVHAIAYPSGDRESQQINSYAIPQLDAMASQSGIAFDNISGATYTSTGYRQSLQSILDSM